MAEQARTARVVAQAKVNLFLRIIGRSTDGYHSIETLFLRLEVGDLVQVRVGSTERRLTCQGPALPAAGLGPAEENLAYRAAVAYTDAAGWPGGFSIDVDKRIPVSAGLGGGSADAGAVLRALDALASKPLGAGSLRQLAIRLGADVPFLASDTACALAWGRGERLLDVAPPPARDVELIVPSFGVSTRAAFAEFAASRATPESSVMLYRLSDFSSWDHLAGLAVNDLEPTVGARHPEILEAIAALRARGARIAMMSGSGSTVFGVFAGTRGGEVDSATDTDDGGVRGVTTIRTRTAERVAGVQLTD